MIDFHSHILPGMDDGSKSTQESLEMLDMLRAQGVDTVAATPHFYARENPPEVFLRRRAEAWNRLRPQLTADSPRVLLGASAMWTGCMTCAWRGRMCSCWRCRFLPGRPGPWRS